MSAPTDPTVGELSEREVLAAILSRLAASQALVGPGDDSAVLAAPDGRIVTSVDTLVEGPDFRLAWTSGYDLGWKAAAVNLADIAAMGARPTALLVALAMPADTRLSFVSALADGLSDACAALAPGCAVEGGDLTVSSTLMVAVTALGSLEGRAAVLRSGARPGDVVAIAGDRGVAARGLDVLFSRFTDADGAALPVTDAVSLSPADTHAVQRQLRPHPPISLGIAAAVGGATAMMDVSDGLALDASRIADASGVTLDVDAALVGTEPVALTGGEDHALLATFPPGTALPPGFERIGTVRARTHQLLLVDGRTFAGRAGWDPYRQV